MPMPSPFDYAIVRVVPRVERGEFINAGIIVFSRTLRYLGARIALDHARLAALAPDLDVSMVQQHLDNIPRICAGGSAAGFIGQLPMSDRFHLLVAPHSTMIQTSPVHGGICSDPEAMLNHLVATMVCI